MYKLIVSLSFSPSPFKSSLVSYHSAVSPALEYGIEKADHAFSHYSSCTSAVIAVEQANGALIRHQVITRSEWKRENAL